MQTEQKKLIHWGIVRISESHFILAATDRGLCYLQFHESDAEPPIHWGRKQFPEYNWIEDKESVLEPYLVQIEEYLRGLRTEFTLPLDLRGTEFQQGVWRALNEIPHGVTHSYSEIAQALNKPSAVRAVGTAIGANPILVVVPCHRVVGKNGALTGYRGGLVNKEKLLELEGARIGKGISEVANVMGS
ncbi:hypothetical protein BC351_19585 [Paenibacillus ferrarius]|uniref:Methylated-DNA--protein-cysteine methyltransferase n=2 Tax=Paenibacillus ferrarius TaxID=1469647 RepID=A0A1V4HPG8_9BACL|nr:methylated-DNA--[protein]-cysteine S-methyltransferase [Paenibacillus ferrarius]OPH59686.1 hypothetical protein BC351_19585 [Paenibacillus ferrarius]